MKFFPHSLCSSGPSFRALRRPLRRGAPAADPPPGSRCQSELHRRSRRHAADLRLAQSRAQHHGAGASRRQDHHAAGPGHGRGRQDAFRTRARHREGARGIHPLAAGEHHRQQSGQRVQPGQGGRPGVDSAVASLSRRHDGARRGARAGGLGPYAAGNRAKVVRQVNGKQTRDQDQAQRSREQGRHETQHQAAARRRARRARIAVL